ncbi:hypothetical protein Pmani_006198 [Petrolisthes manimaculis]|uniref:Uncharacterized protein n=1 Tax=Petrolisthes manimaculis TaxID=1843537 RepID=A0AAE1QC92_9EUCA|nr:hypothetical protein Pmani_006198 [Petrolisthes manimaculis]
MWQEHRGWVCLPAFQSQPCNQYTTCSPPASNRHFPLAGSGRPPTTTPPPPSSPTSPEPPPAPALGHLQTLDKWGAGEATGRPPQPTTSLKNESPGEWKAACSECRLGGGINNNSSSTTTTTTSSSQQQQ